MNAEFDQIRQLHKQISIVLLCFNETNLVPSTLAEIEAFKKTGFDFIVGDFGIKVLEKSWRMESIRFPLPGHR